MSTNVQVQVLSPAPKKWHTNGTSTIEKPELVHIGKYTYWDLDTLDFYHDFGKSDVSFYLSFSYKFYEVFL